MISNYHTASSGPAGENDYYYTFGGMDEEDPPVRTSSTANNNSNSNNNKKTHTSKSTSAALKKVAAGGRTRRFGWGRSRTANSNTNPTPYNGSRRSSADTVSAESMGGQSLTYSTGSSIHSIGDSTTSSTSGFSRMIKVLEAEDRIAATGGKSRLGASLGGSQPQKQQQQQHKRVPSAGQSVASSLNYSDSDASYTRFGGSSSRGGGGSSAMSQRSEESMDYSTDASEKSQLEGSKLIQMLLNE